MKKQYVHCWEVGKETLPEFLARYSANWEIAQVIITEFGVCSYDKSQYAKKAIIITKRY